MVDKIANPAAAANAYANTAKVANIGTVGDTGADKITFGDVLKNAAVESIQTMRAGESMSAKAITGDASLPELVQAVTASELTLQTVVAIRDRVIGAYQEIMRMSI